MKRVVLARTKINDPLETNVTLEFGAAQFTLLPEGGLWWQEKSLLIVADLHLEKSSHFAKRGQFLPPYDSQTTLQNLSSLVHKTCAQKLLVLGDNFHDAMGFSRLNAACNALLARLNQQCDILWLSGNHDSKTDDARAPDGTACLPQWRIENFIFRHAPTHNLDTDMIEICGHLHPVARIKTPHQILRRRVFIATPQRIFVPAFGVLTGGLNIRDEAFAPYLAPPFKIFAISRDGVFPIADENCLGEAITQRFANSAH